jgi:hypothetical protein
LEKNKERKAWCITILTIFAVVFWLAEGTFRLPTAAIKGHLREGIKRRKLGKLKINAKRLRYLQGDFFTDANHYFFPANLKIKYANYLCNRFGRYGYSTSILCNQHCCGVD